MGYLFGGDTGVTQDAAAQQRKLALAMLEKQQPANTIPQGLANLANVLMGNAELNRENTLQQGWDAYGLGKTDAPPEEPGFLSSLAGPIFGKMFSGKDASQSASPSLSPSFDGTSASQDKMRADAGISGTNANLAAQNATLVDPTISNGRVADRGSMPGYSGVDLKTGIAQTAQALGISPVDLATAISYETGGTFDPTQKGPRTQWGQHKGLIQFGEPQAREFGVDWNDPMASQLGADGAVAKYLKNAGVTPGMGLLDIYSAINAGGVGRYNASDANNGGAPGTVADKVNYQMAKHRSNALAMFGDQNAVSPAAAAIQQQAPIGPTEVASLDPSAGMGQPQQAAQTAPTNAAIMGAPSLPTQSAPQLPTSPAASPIQKLAQAQLSQQSPQIDTQRLMAVASSPYASSGVRNLAASLLQQQQELQMKQADPMYRMGLEKTQLEIDNLKNPPGKWEVVTGKDGSIFRVNPVNGQHETIYGPQTTPTGDIQEYEYAKKQGFQGSFAEYQQQMKKAGAQSINIDQKAESQFDKTLAEKQAASFDAMATDGMNAKADLALVGKLGDLLKGQGGTLTGISGVLAGLGIGGEGMGDLQAADALIEKLVPSQRAPGSGTMSDADIKMFRASLPSLWKSPSGNQIILNTMQGLAQYKQAQGDIAQRVMIGEIDRKEAVKMLRELPNPLEGFRKSGASQPSQSPDPVTKDAEPQKIQSIDDYNRVPSGTRYIDPQGNIRVKK